MEDLLFKTAVTLVVLVLFFGIWVGVHLLARRRIGDRKLGCRGPTLDEEGNTVCCNADQSCEQEDKRKKSRSPDSITSP